MADKPALTVFSLSGRDKGQARMSEAEIDWAARADAALETIERVRAGVGAVVLGQERVVEQTLCALLAGGHGLLVGAPGLAKTLLVETLAVTFGLDWRRVQFTPDLMPADILGAEVLEENDKGRRSFRFIPGPVFTSLLMADEINRASPRTQSALLQAMQERHVSVAGVRHDLPVPFHVFATQNPIEQEGTYPLPEAQLDRFLLQIDVPYPDAETERRILLATTGAGSLRPAPAASVDDLLALQALVRRMPVGESVLEAILRLVRAGRPSPDGRADVREAVAWGPGPRAGQALSLAARARALLRGRLAPSLDDVAALARPALVHRLGLSWSARADGVRPEALIDAMTAEALAPA
jgi:MoxR-like ATPase